MFALTFLVGCTDEMQYTLLKSRKSKSKIFTNKQVVCKSCVWHHMPNDFWHALHEMLNGVLRDLYYDLDRATVSSWSVCGAT